MLLKSARFGKRERCSQCLQHIQPHPLLEWMTEGWGREEREERGKGAGGIAKAQFLFQSEGVGQFGSGFFLIDGGRREKKKELPDPRLDVGSYSYYIDFKKNARTKSISRRSGTALINWEHGGGGREETHRLVSRALRIKTKGGGRCRPGPRWFFLREEGGVKGRGEERDMHVLFLPPPLLRSLNDGYTGPIRLGGGKERTKRAEAASLTQYFLHWSACSGKRIHPARSRASS